MFLRSDLRATLATHKGTVFLYGALAALSAMALAILAARIFYSGTVAHGYMPWNLFLAWVPLGLAAIMSFLDARGRAGTPSLLAVGFLWLLFFPNAPYLLTEFVHLHPSYGVNDRPLQILAGLSPAREVPLWYDVAMLGAFAWCGLMLAFVSLHLVQRCISRRVGAAWGWTAVVVILWLSGFGVSIGRFQRWNSWDLFLRPAALLSDVASRLFNPLAHPRTTTVTLIFWSVLLLAYLALAGFAALRQNADAADRPSNGPAAA